MPEFGGAVLDDTGVAISGATVDIYDINTSTPSRANTTTDASGLWGISHGTEGAFDVKVVNGSDVVWMRAKDKIQFTRLELLESAANLEALVVTRTEDVASLEVATFEANRPSPADDDLAYLSFKMSDSAGNQDEQARIGWSATTVASGGTQDGDLIISVLVNNSLTEIMRFDGSATQVSMDDSTKLTFGTSDDVTMNFNGTTFIINRLNQNFDASTTAQYIRYTMPTITDTVTAGSGTVTNVFRMIQYDQNTLDATNSSVTYNDAIMLNVNKPVGGSNVTITRPWAIWADGPINIDDSTDISTSDVNLAAFHVGGGVSVNKSMQVANSGTGILYVNDQDNNGMTVGLIIDQGTNTDDIVALQSSSSIDHGLVSQVETDVFFRIKKVNGGIGGVTLDGFAEDGALTSVLLLRSFGGTADTTKTTSGRALVEVGVAEHDDGDNLADITADGNVFGVRARVGAASVTRFMIDEDGDMFTVAVTDVTGSGNAATATAFDNEDDVALIRAFEIVRDGVGLVRDEFDDFVRYNESDLIRVGVLGAPTKDGGLWNVTQHMRLMNGAIWQQAKKIMVLEAKLAALPEGS